MNSVTRPVWLSGSLGGRRPRYHWQVPTSRVDEILRWSLMFKTYNVLNHATALKPTRSRTKSKNGWIASHSTFSVAPTSAITKTVLVLNSTVWHPERSPSNEIRNRDRPSTTVGRRRKCFYFRFAFWRLSATQSGSAELTPLNQLFDDATRATLLRCELIWSKRINTN